MDKTILKHIAAITAIIILAVSFVLLLSSQDTFALVVVGEEYGLRVHLSEEYVPTDILNPGDTKTSIMTISNTGEVSSSLPAYLKTEITGSSPGFGGGNLDDKLNLTIKRNSGEELYNGPFSGLAREIELGSIETGKPTNLEFTVHLPGSTSNEYQAASLSVKWEVRTNYESSNPPGESPQQSSTPESSPVPSNTPGTTDIKDDTMPTGGAEDETPGNNQEIELDDEQVPEGDLPKTGEIAPLFFYLFGLILIFIGVMIRTKKKKPVIK